MRAWVQALKEEPVVVIVVVLAWMELAAIGVYYIVDRVVPGLLHHGTC